jgi:hypothetical protein
MNRACATISVDVTDTLESCEAIQYQNFEYGEFSVESSESPSSLAWYSSHDNVTYRPAYTAAGAVSQSVSNGAAYPIPASLTGAKWIKVVGNCSMTLNMVLKG